METLRSQLECSTYIGVPCTEFEVLYNISMYSTYWINYQTIMLLLQSYVMKKRDFLKSCDFRVALLKGLKRVCQYVCIYLSMYLCHTMDPGNREVTMLKEPISHLLFLAHCDVIEQPAKTDTLTISDHKERP